MTTPPLVTKNIVREYCAELWLWGASASFALIVFGCILGANGLHFVAAAVIALAGLCGGIALGASKVENRFKD